MGERRPRPERPADRRRRPAGVHDRARRPLRRRAPGLSVARFYSIWNEPNSPRFLKAANAPAAYARLVAAGYAGVKAGSPQALVAAGETASRNALVQLDNGEFWHVLHVPALELKSHIPTAEVVGITYRLRDTCGTMQQAAKIEPDGWVPIQVSFRLQPGRHYFLDVEINDIHGWKVRRTLELVGSGPKPPASGAAASTVCGR